MGMAALAGKQDTTEIDQELDDLNLQLVDLNLGLDKEQKSSLEARLANRRKKRAKEVKVANTTEAGPSEELKEDLAYEALSVAINTTTTDRESLRKRLEER